MSVRPFVRPCVSMWTTFLFLAQSECQIYLKNPLIQAKVLRLLSFKSGHWLWLEIKIQILHNSLFSLPGVPICHLSLSFVNYGPIYVLKGGDIHMRTHVCPVNWPCLFWITCPPPPKEKVWEKWRILTAFKVQWSHLYYNNGCVSVHLFVCPCVSIWTTWLVFARL